MTETRPGTITIVGLGPGSADLLTRRTWRVLQDAAVVYLRTDQHPAVADLPAHLRRHSFDHVYDDARDFSAVYKRITERVVQLARKGQDVVYAVPGDPHVGEATVAAILEEASRADVPTSVLPGVSFVEPTLAALGKDGLDGLQLFDAITVAGYNHPPVNSDHPLLLGQVYNRLLANELKLALMAVYPDEHRVSLVHAAGTPEQRVEQIPLYEIDRSPHIGNMTSLFVPPLPAPGSLPALAETAAILRSPEGCPWDQEQTPQTLRAGFLEEVAEALDALDAADPGALQEELGDVLFHVVMQAQMAREKEQFRLGDVVAGIYAKIRRRHPHVWGDWQVAGSDEVVANWEAIKAGEEDRPRPQSLLDDVPAALPALARAQKIQERVRRVGFDWPVVEDVVQKVQEEIDELRQAQNAQEQAAEMGDVLFALVNWARWLGLDAESTLREAAARFTRRFRLLEDLARSRSLDLDDADLETMDALWREAKRSLDQERAPE
jgi:tetrapyrrole methylase family protein/MazG family protein